MQHRRELSKRCWINDSMQCCYKPSNCEKRSVCEAQGNQSCTRLFRRRQVLVPSAQGPRDVWRTCSVPRAQSCPTLCDPVDYSPPGSSVHGILQASILERVAMPSSRGSSRPREPTRISCVSCTGRQILCHGAIGKAPGEPGNPSTPLLVVLSLSYAPGCPLRPSQSRSKGWAASTEPCGSSRQQPPSSGGTRTGLGVKEVPSGRLLTMSRTSSMHSPSLQQADRVDPPHARAASEGLGTGSSWPSWAPVGGTRILLAAAGPPPPPGAQTLQRVVTRCRGDRSRVTGSV